MHGFLRTISVQAGTPPQRGIDLEIYIPQLEEPHDHWDLRMHFISFAIWQLKP